MLVNAPTVIQMSGGPVERLRKPAIRRRVLAARALLTSIERQQAAALLRDRVLALSEVQAATTVAAYRSMPDEPGTGPLLEALHARDVTVLLPVLRPDLSLDWGVHDPGSERLNIKGVAEPASPPLGPQALAAASVVICPGVAGDVEGHRLGRGGGSYDQALTSLDHSELRVLLLYDDEVLAAVPTDPHDQPVDVLITRTRTLWCHSA